MPCLRRAKQLEQTANDIEQEVEEGSDNESWIATHMSERISEIPDIDDVKEAEPEEDGFAFMELEDDEVTLSAKM